MSESDVLVIKGEVIDVSRLSHTEVWSSGGGGGGYVGPHGGHVSVSAPRIHSQATTNTDIFIRDESGKERHVRIYDQDIPLRAGHQLELAYVKNGSEWELAVLLNQSTEKFWELDCCRIGSGRAFITNLLTLFSAVLGLISVVAFIGCAITVAVNIGRRPITNVTGLVALSSVVGFGITVSLNQMVERLRFGPKKRALQKAKKALVYSSKAVAKKR